MQGKPTLNDTLELMRDLRERCEWDRAQTHQSLRPYLIEEVHELDDAIRGGDTAHMRDELEDVREVWALRASPPTTPAEAPPAYDDAHRKLEAELGDLLFACVNLCRR